MIKAKASSFGTLRMLMIKGANCRYEVVVGASTVKIMRYS